MGTSPLYWKLLYWKTVYWKTVTCLRRRAERGSRFLLVLLLVSAAALVVSACSTSSEGSDKPSGDTEGVGLPIMTGFCAEIPVSDIVALFEDAAIDMTAANANPQTCHIEVKSDRDATIASFTAGVVADTGPDAFEEMQEDLFASNREIEEETDSGSRPFREAFLLGDQAEIITGAISQLSILDGDRIWYVQHRENDVPLASGKLVEIGRLLLDNAPMP